MKRLLLTAALVLALLTGYVSWASHRCQSTLTSTGLPCPRAPLGPDRFCATHDGPERERIQALIESLKKGEHLR